ncbi:VOC family protein [Pseudarthrobacter sp. P1]|uniref:VOC family protein n=1 Tax=Pseudarthrobacter sp. P1 TaxID=3418418 RepID=UPI003CEB1CCB
MSSFSIAPGDPCWIDLVTADPQRSKEFYAALFGWSYDGWDEQAVDGYIMAFKDGGTVAGMVENGGGSGYPDSWTTYLRADGIAAVAAAVPGHGGRVLIGPMVVSAQGSMALVADPSGATVGLWQPGLHPGFGVHGLPGSAVRHQLLASDYDASVAFYNNAFGWETQAGNGPDGQRRATLGAGPHATAAIIDASADLPAQAPGHWQVAFGVDDADAAAAAAAALGARVLSPVGEDGHGRSATLADPTGAVFQIAQLP